MYIILCSSGSNLDSPIYIYPGLKSTEFEVSQARHHGSRDIDPHSEPIFMYPYTASWHTMLPPNEFFTPNFVTPFRIGYSITALGRTINGGTDD